MNRRIKNSKLTIFWLFCAIRRLAYTQDRRHRAHLISHPKQPKRASNYRSKRGKLEGKRDFF